MKKAISIILAVLTIFALIALLTSCGHANTDALDGHGKRFELIQMQSNFWVYVDMETGVEWVWSKGSFRPVIDSYGNPYIYPAFDAREDAK